MAKFFIPYSGEKPAFLLINGHKLVLLSQDKRLLLDALDDVGADRLEVVSARKEEQEHIFHAIAQKNEAGVVVAPRNASCQELIRTLELQLPWVQ